MNYLRAYNNIVERAQDRERPTEYVEKHHILPKCMGGLNTKDNIVFLTAKEHFICHKLLVRIFPDVKGNWYALVAMGRIPEYKSRIVASERKKAAEMRRGFKYADKSKKQMSESAIRRGVHKNSEATLFGNKPPWNKGLKNWRPGYVHSVETRAKITAANIRGGNIPPWVLKHEEKVS
jgi:hypothetical protein